MRFMPEVNLNGDLIRSINEENLDFIQRQLEGGVTFSIVDILYVARHEGKAQVVDFMIRHIERNINEINVDVEFLRACEFGFLRLAQIFLEQSNRLGDKKLKYSVLSQDTSPKFLPRFFSVDNHMQVEQELTLEAEGLAHATLNGHLDVVTFLLERHPHFNLPAFINAVQNGHTAIVERFAIAFPSERLIQKFTTDWEIRTGFPSLVDVVKSGHGELLEFLLANQANPNFLCPINQLTPLMLASQLGDIETIDRLLAHQANINKITGCSKQSALNSAAKGGHIEIIQQLIARGATLINPSANQDFFPGDGEHPAIVAARFGQISVVDWFLTHPEFGFEINHIFIDNKMYRDDYVGLGIDCTLLMEAARHGQTALVEHLLVSHNANINAKNDAGDTALSATCKTHFTQTLELLLQYGAEVNLSAIYESGWKMEGLFNLECIGLLLEHDTNPDCDQALIEIVRGDLVESAKLFLKYGAEFQGALLNSPHLNDYQELNELFLDHYADEERPLVSNSHTLTL